MRTDLEVIEARLLDGDDEDEDDDEDEEAEKVMSVKSRVHSCSNL